MKNFTQKFIGLFALVFAMSFTVNSQEIGDVYQGGYLFYIDDTGENGLIASSEDIEGSYEWGCYEIDVSGADGVSIGTGFPNTLDIINNGCSTEIGGFNATQVAFEYEIGGYTDWYLPSKDELIEMYNTIGNGGDQGNIGEFNTTPGFWYWSSSENNNNLSFGMSFNDGYSNNAPKSNFYLVRAIRSVTFETETLYEINDPCTSLSDYNSILLDLNPIQSRDFIEGWNMFGFPCKESRSISETFAHIVSDVFIIKDNEGLFYWPEFDFDGIGELIPLEGYQTKLYNSISDFSFCENSIEFPSIYGCTDCDALNYNPFANVDDTSCTEIIYGCTYEMFYNYDSLANLDDGSCIPFIYGCMDESACNYNPEANTDDGSCEYPEQGYDCDGNITADIGDIIEGGYLFYIDESGQHGLVAAIDDLPDTYEWGCNGTDVSGAISGANVTSIGTGYENTMDIVNQGCETENGGITAAQASIDFDDGSYSDWYLPSKDELVEMYNTIGNDGLEGNIGGFSENVWYWSSSEGNPLYAEFVDFENGYTSGHVKYFAYRVRVIRAF